MNVFKPDSDNLAPIYVALDVDSLTEALGIARACKGLALGFKVGPRICMQASPSFYNELQSCGQIFIDQKFYDIPNTMHAAVQACFDLGASVVTVHASSGAEALSRLAELESKLNRFRPFRVLAVTVLTSFEASTLPANWIETSIPDHVQMLAEGCDRAGIKGLVCSAKEVAFLRQSFPASFLLVPGIRLSGDGLDDQARVGQPQEAMRCGASALVVGRPVVDSPDPRASLQRYIRAINEEKLSGV